jgi:RecB family exonuclease
LEEHPPELDRREAYETLLDMLQTEQIGHAGDDSGNVRILSAASVRSLQIPYLFLAGLSEKAFPPPEQEARLYSEAEYARLIDAGLPLTTRSDRNREEMLLFYEVLTRATKQLYLSYPALDDSAQPLSPSPYLQEVEQVCDDRIPRTELADLSPVPRDLEPLSEEDFRLKAIATALDGDVSLLAGLVKTADEEHTSPARADKLENQTVFQTGGLSELVEHLTAGLELNQLRQTRDGFGPAEGVFSSRTSHQYLLTRYSSRHLYSATELEQYASCPFRFFLERILQLAPQEDLSLSIDALHRGSIAHDILAIFHRRVNVTLGRPASPLELEPAVFDRLLASALEEGTSSHSSNPVQSALQEINRRQVSLWLSEYRTQLEKYDRQWAACESPLVPEIFEVSFGRDDAEPPSSDQTLEINFGNQTIRIYGRIDRIDTGIVAGHTVFNVLDYKTGGSNRLTPDSVMRGTTLQLPLYAIAVMDVILTDRDAVPWQAAYWYLREGGIKPRQALQMYYEENGRIELDPAWETIRDALGETVAGLVRGIQHGRFQVCSVDEHCTGYCSFNTVCRINQVRSLEKTCLPALDAKESQESQ